VKVSEPFDDEREEDRTREACSSVSGAVGRSQRVVALVS